LAQGMLHIAVREGKQTMKLYRHKVTGQFHARLSDGSLSKGFATLAELKALLAKLRRNAAQRERYAAMRDCGMVKTTYGWE
jgi:hypothetical protein